MESSTLYRKAAGVYFHLVKGVVVKLQLGQERPPPEATASLPLVMHFICLAEAQVTF